jgi:hypothetical protein
LKIWGAVPSLKFTCTHTSGADAAVDVPAVSVSAQAPGIAHRPIPTRSVESVASSARSLRPVIVSVG